MNTTPFNSLQLPSTTMTNGIESLLSKPEKKKIKFFVVHKVDFMDELRKAPRVGTTSRLQLDKNLEALKRRRKEREDEEIY